MAEPDASAVVHDRERLHQLTELAAVVVLSTSALGSTYAGFQAGLWDGEQDANYALAAKAQNAAVEAKAVALQRESVNAMHFTQWLNAYAADNDELADFYRDRFRPVFREAFDAWLASRPRINPASPPTPFDVPGYQERSSAFADRLQSQSDGYFRAGTRDTRTSDGYSQSVVVFALALFLGGIVQAFDSDRIRILLVALAALACLTALVLLGGLPRLQLV